MPNSQSKYCLRFVVDTFILILVVVGVFLIKKLWLPFQRGMLCDDHTLSYPYKQDTISDSVLLLFGVSFPLVFIFVQELLRVRREAVGKDIYLFGRRLSRWFWATYSSVGVFLFGCACSQLATDLAKHCVGSLRPHFIAVCKPDWNKTTCGRSNFESSYVYPIPCTGSDLDLLKDARMSFPSAHASFSAFTMVYLVIYIQNRLQVRNFTLLKPTLQASCLLVTLFTCLTRVSDYAHHTLDVVAGFGIGCTIAVLCALYVSDLYQPHRFGVAHGSKKIHDQEVMMIGQQEDQGASPDGNHTGR